MSKILYMIRDVYIDDCNPNDFKLISFDRFYGVGDVYIYIYKLFMLN